MNFRSVNLADHRPVPDVDLGLFHAAGHDPITVPFGVNVQCLLHEIGPDGHCRIGAFHAEVVAVIKTDIDDANKLGRKSREPPVPRCARLAGKGRLSRIIAKAPALYLRRRAAIDDVFHDVVHDISDVRPDDALAVGCYQRNRAAVAGGDLGNRHWKDAVAEVREHRVACRHLQRRRLGRAESHRRISLFDFWKSRFVGQIHDLADVELHRKIDRDDVFAFDERVAQREFLVRKNVAKVSRRVAVLVECECFLFVLKYTGRRKNARACIVRRVDRGCVNERLEHRARLSHRVGRTVKLVLLIIASADHRHDLAGLWPDGDESGVEAAFRLFREKLVQLFEPFADGFVGHSLQVGVDRGVNAEVLESLRVADDLRQFLDHVLRKIRHSLKVFSVCDLFQLDRRRTTLVELLPRDLADLEHRFQHLISTFDNLFRSFVWIVAVRAANDAGNERGIGQCQLRHILAEIGVRSLAYAIDRNARLLPEIDLICVKRKDLLLGQPRLEDNRHISLGDLSLEGRFVG